MINPQTANNYEELLGDNVESSPYEYDQLSLIFPGLGDWYLGHRGFATMELLGSTFVWLALVDSPAVLGP